MNRNFPNPLSKTVFHKKEPEIQRQDTSSYDLTSDLFHTEKRTNQIDFR